MARTKYVAGNWKMNLMQSAARELAAAVAAGVDPSSQVMVGVFPPFTALAAVREVLRDSPVILGGQNCHYEVEGAFTGEVSASMLVDAGCTQVILGHSERRHGLGETSEVINRKLFAALAAGLTAIVCVGELLDERRANRTEQVLSEQLTGSLSGLSLEQLARVVIAYEPVWAIGTGQVATPEQAQAAHAFIRGQIAATFGENAAAALLIQYGGSVKPENARGLLQLPDVDGALVGGASLKADQFLAIVRAAI